MAVSKAVFKLGVVVMTAGVADKLGQCDFVKKSLDRHVAGDWGDLTPHDVKVNQEALVNGGRLMSVYPFPGRTDLTIWVITEADRSATTVLFPEDY